ncbi:ABC transporter ATP-binding protein [Terribacillus sp. 179-K 1B1 HS]|uniref:ABC transporter ATP-binding protein n=1 Tax=Terribacillus sp. 179-K 1B1 HS TaxID=3142388 RepID=UPI0039A3CBFF
MLMLNHISKSFHGQSVLRDITFQMSEGESILLLGANGAGKSTLIKIILRMLQQDAGRIQWATKSPRIGYVPQSPSMIGNLTVRQFASYVLSLHGRRFQVGTVLKDAGLDAKRKMLAENLSAGQMKRLLFQLAVVTKPKLLIMDEPTAGMDVEAKRLFRKQLSAVRADGVSVLITTHILAEAEEIADRLLYLEDGMLTVDRSIDEIRQLRQSVSFRTDKKHQELLLSMGYSLHEGLFRKLTDDADKELQLLIQRSIQLKQLEIKGDTLEKYVEGLSREGAGL